MGPPFGQPAINVVVVVDSKCDISVLLISGDDDEAPPMMAF